MSDAPICIDISHWQDFPQFDQVYTAGVRGMIHKATEGCTYQDPNRKENCANAMEAGILISTYYWLKPGDGRDQTDFYLDTIQPVVGERVCIDYEEEGCTLHTLEDAVTALLDAKKDLKITVYSGHLLKQELGENYNDLLAENTDLWLAQYTSGEPSWPEETYPEWHLWQYSESGTIDGIDDTYVDLNKYCGNDQEFVNWISPDGQKPIPPAHDLEREVRREARRVARRTAERVVRRLIKRGPDI